MRLLSIALACSVAVTRSQQHNIQHFETLLLRGSDGKADIKPDTGGSDGEHGPAYTAIASIIAGAEHEDGDVHNVHNGDSDDQSFTDGNSTHGADSNNDDCADQEGLTAIRINGEFVACADLVQYCEKYEQVQHSCPATCGLCDHRKGLSAPLSVDSGEDDSSGNEQEDRTNDDDSADTGDDFEQMMFDDNSIVEKEEEEDDKLTPEEHVIALKLLLKKVGCQCLVLSGCKMMPRGAFCCQCPIRHCSYLLTPILLHTCAFLFRVAIGFRFLWKMSICDYPCPSAR